MADELTVVLSVSSFAEADPKPLELLRESGARVVENPHGRKLKEDEVSELIAEADGVIAGTEPLNANVLGKASRLKAISRVGVGLDNVDLDAAEQHGIRVFNTPDAVTDAAAELAFAGMLGVLRHLHWMDAEMRAGRWSRKMGSLLRGKTVGIVGLGRVGKRVGELLQPFEPNLLAYDVEPDNEWAQAHGVRMVDLFRLVSESDVVTLHASGAGAEGAIMNDARIDAMKPGAVLVNAARGGLVDEAALADALREERLGGAYLDTFESEPYEGPLTELPNVMLTPHAGSFAREARFLMEMEAVQNLLGFLKA